jgi:hypothetical protein
MIRAVSIRIFRQVLALKRYIPRQSVIYYSAGTRPVDFRYTLLPIALKDTSAELVLLAWYYVVLRVAHAWIHTGRNQLRPRIAAYMLSWVVLLWMWAALIVSESAECTAPTPGSVAGPLQLKLSPHSVNRPLTAAGGDGAISVNAD